MNGTRERRGQYTTKITSASAELCIQSPLFLALMNLLLGVVLHSSSLVTMAIPMSHWDYLSQVRDSPVWITTRVFLYKTTESEMRYHHDLRALPERSQSRWTAGRDSEPRLTSALRECS